MTKLLIGLDCEDESDKTISLLRRINFEGAEWHLAHVASATDKSPMLLEVTPKGPQALSEEQYVTERLFSQASNALSKIGIQATTHLVTGSPAKQLICLSDELDADIVAVRSEAHGVLGSALIGSVGRAIALGDRSFMLARGEIANAGLVKAIFATDYSVYARRGLDLLIQMKPKGLSEIVCLTAVDMLELSEMDQYTSLLQDASVKGLSFTEIIEQHGKEAVEHLRKAGIKGSSEIRHGFVSHAIHDAMEEHKADLLILGAQGHGFIERMVIGSVALGQAVSSPKSVLVIRSQIKSNS